MICLWHWYSNRSLAFILSNGFVGANCNASGESRPKDLIINEARPWNFVLRYPRKAATSRNMSDVCVPLVMCWSKLRAFECCICLRLSSTACLLWCLVMDAINARKISVSSSIAASCMTSTREFPAPSLSTLEGHLVQKICKCWQVCDRHNSSRSFRACCSTATSFRLVAWAMRDSNLCTFLWNFSSVFRCFLYCFCDEVSCVLLCNGIGSLPCCGCWTGRDSSFIGGRQMRTLAHGNIIFHSTISKQIVNHCW